DAAVQLERDGTGGVAAVRDDADRGEQEPILRMLCNEGADPAPEEQKGVVVLLIFGPDERASELQCRGAHAGQETLVVAEERSRVETVNAARARDLVRAADSVGADDLLLLRIPREQMQVRAVELIEVDAATGAFADSLEGDLAQASDLAQRRRNHVSGRAEHPERAALDEARTFVEPRDLLRDLVVLANRHADRLSALPQQLAPEE